MAPSGGSGGDGGNVIFTVDPSFNTLLGFRGRSNFKAEHGAEGSFPTILSTDESDHLSVDLSVCLSDRKSVV